MPRRKDPKDPDGMVVIGDFGGWTPNADPHDVPPGVSIEQVNAMSWKPGELRVRPGYRVVQFDSK